MLGKSNTIGSAHAVHHGMKPGNDTDICRTMGIEWLWLEHIRTLKEKKNRKRKQGTTTSSSTNNKAKRNKQTNVQAGKVESIGAYY